MRHWVDDGLKNPIDKRWVMRCDNEVAGYRCTTTTEPEISQPSLAALHAAGWHIAKLCGDICPGCIAAGAPTGTPYFEETS